MRFRQSFEGFRFSEPSKFSHHSSSNPRFLYTLPYITSNNPLSYMDACGCHRTTQPSLYPGQTIVFARSLISMKPYWIKCKFQEKKNVLIASGFVEDVGKLLQTLNPYSSPSQHWSSVVFWPRRLGRIPKLIFTIRKLGAWRGLFRMKWAKGPSICWSYWASRPQGSSGFTPWGSRTWAISPIKQASKNTQPSVNSLPQWPLLMWPQFHCNL